MPKLIIDGDILLFRCGFAVEKTHYLVSWPDGVDAEAFQTADGAKASAKPKQVIWNRKEVEPVENALALMNASLLSICDKYNDNVPLVYISPGVGNFRERIATRAKYKGNREGASKPVHYGALRQVLIENWKAKVAVGQEADDACGIAMTDNPGSVCVSIDKDMLQIPGTHYNWVTKEEQTISPKEASLNFWTQVLAGDATDNVPGIEGIGVVKARKMLEKATSKLDCRVIAKAAYAEKYGGAGWDYMIETAKLVYIRRKPDEVWTYE